MDGLLHDSLKMKLMRDNPNTFQAAVNTALQEQNLRRRFNLRTNQGERLGRRDAPMEADHMRHSRHPRHQGTGDRSNHYRKAQHIHAVNQKML